MTGALPDHEFHSMLEEHAAALARSEKRTLLRTRDGGMYSYRKDELGFRRSSNPYYVRTWWGVGVIAVIELAGVALGIYLFVSPGLHDEAAGWTPFWGALWLIAIGGLLLAVSVTLMVRELRARRRRRERGAPEPA
ncbi:hypothetical protein [Humibacter ginsenosidimutans]|uniref:Uncharacterized protein n=1 Tax=Humibacter ginsenosidimutans TaxID=2599293 RepID=A0A5B8M7C8_9MICO|nr:hypothetical protein [Humibacter ginsenosidimutans]QDZ16101.1 hypothetical protein FPZ11_16215 [Humibacter ginsenosidimutans]